MPDETLSSLEKLFLDIWRIYAGDLPEPEHDYHFARELIGDSPYPPARPNFRERMKRACLGDWKFDFAWRDSLVAVELEGGTWMKKARHTSGKGYSRDCKKYNTAQANGWRVYRFTSDMLKDDPEGCVRIVAKDVLGIDKRPGDMV